MCRRKSREKRWEKDQRRKVFKNQEKEKKKRREREKREREREKREKGGGERNKWNYRKKKKKKNSKGFQTLKRQTLMGSRSSLMSLADKKF